jgi:hypothetical protein
MSNSMAMWQINQPFESLEIFRMKREENVSWAKLNRNGQKQGYVLLPLKFNSTEGSHCQAGGAASGGHPSVWATNLLLTGSWAGRPGERCDGKCTVTDTWSAGSKPQLGCQESFPGGDSWVSDQRTVLSKARLKQSQPESYRKGAFGGLDVTLMTMEVMDTFLLFVFWQYWVWTQGLTLARKEPLQLSHTSALFAWIIFWLGSHVSAWQAGLWSFYLQPPAQLESQTYATTPCLLVEMGCC